jgi:hypothetical protein
MTSISVDRCTGFKNSIRLYKCRFGETAAISNRKGVAEFLDVVEKLRKASVSFVMRLRPSVHPSFSIKQLARTGRIFIILDT